MAEGMVFCFTVWAVIVIFRLLELCMPTRLGEDVDSNGDDF